MSAEELREVVESNEKQRFAFDETGAMIRANQGHSVSVDLELTPTAPPELLFHGTGAGSVESILRSGLERRNRHHVHLSLDQETARRVGMRHGKPVIVTRRGRRDGPGRARVLRQRQRRLARGLRAPRIPAPMNRRSGGSLMPMTDITGVDFVAIMTKDHDAAVQFYGETLACRS